MTQNFADAEPVIYFHKMRNIEIKKVEKAKTNPRIILIGKSNFDNISALKSTDGFVGPLYT